MRSGDRGTHSNWKRKVELHEAQKIIELPKKEKQINIEPEIAFAPEWIQKIMPKNLHGKIIVIFFLSQMFTTFVTEIQQYHELIS